MTGTTGVHVLVRRAHEERVLAILRERGGLSRAQIAARAGLSRTTLSEITGDLLTRGAIVVVTTDALVERDDRFYHWMTSMYDVGEVDHDPTLSGLDEASYTS
jgi:DNA-binding Lrp family transcriptional regulator